MRKRNPAELSFDQCLAVMDQLGDFGRPLIVFTGGDPLEREDLFQLIAAAKERGFPVAITPSATPLMTRDVIRRLAASGVERLAISIDGPDADTHDGFRRVRGSFDLSLDIARWAEQVGLPLQINTTIYKNNWQLFDSMAELVLDSYAVLWSVFFLVPTGRASNDMQITAVQCEHVLRKMARLSATTNLHVKATAAPHFRRVIINSLKAAAPGSDSCSMPAVSPLLKLGALRSYDSVNDGKGVLFISNTGDVSPSGFLPLTAGNVKNQSIISIYRDSEMFRELRDPALLKGKCGRCRYRHVCGGSRARAFGTTGDYLAQDDLCAYVERD
jgi:radical SAM protein with 4Fe4S-binding SPASM domain